MEWRSAETLPNDGRIVLVILDRQQVDEYRQCHAPRTEYTGDPVAVRAWGDKLNTTWNSLRLDRDWVVLWCDVLAGSLAYSAHSDSGYDSCNGS